jgi:hypothetical protein
MQIEAFGRIDGGAPWRIENDAPRIPQARLPACVNSIATEIDVFGMVLPFQLRREKAHDMHLRQTAMTRHFANDRRVPLLLRQTRRQFRNDMS